ncbi:outer membrane beta-barrel protein [Microbulbifer sp. SAOS-129_SWC]|uniref:outer membrane beta-barrel protein n=1 Tax=Microbulbifer sp. SAOS-129_SWC TaxID=3145235 RepID=UPI0032172F27
MKKVLFALAMLCSAAASAVEWNNPIEGICAGEYRVIGTLGAGIGEQQVNDDRDTFAYGSVGITPTVGLWQVELRYSNFSDEGISVDQYGVNFKVDFTLDCDVQCLYWMAGWSYAEIDLDAIRDNGWLIPVDEHGYDNYWNAGVGYRYMWTRDFDTSIEYNYNDVGRVNHYGLGHLRSLTINLSYRF